MTMMGAIVNSPPINFNPLITKKFHICTFCWATSVQHIFKKEESVGVDAVLYVWGEKIPDEKLSLINQGFLEVFGEESFGYKNQGIEPCNWFDDVPGTSLYRVDTDLARWFHHTHKPRTGWGTIKPRIEFCQLHLPDHFIIYTNDSVNLEDMSHADNIVTDEFIQLCDVAYAKFLEEVGW